MAAPGKSRPIQPSQTGNRQEDNANRDTRLALGDVGKDIETLDVAVNALIPSMMPIDGLTDYLWPMNDEAGSLVVGQKVTGKNFPLTLGNSAFAGSLSELGGKCLRLADDSGNAFARVTTTPVPTYTTGSLSCWYWTGDASSSGNKRIFGNFSSSMTSTHFNILCNKNGSQLLFGAFVLIGAASFLATSAGDGCVSSGAWHHVGAVHTGTTLIAYVDGRAVASVAAAGDINWTDGGGSVWNVGAALAATPTLPGFIQDVRVHSGPRPKEWFEEAYLRGKGRFF